jgi:DNA sulfur modification protein DndD
MQVSRVKLNNFRQFYGEQELLFPIDDKHNVTIIHAENGFGKTSILNAVLWCLYRQVTPKFERPDDIVNYDALDEGTTSAFVEVELCLEDSKFMVQRTFDAAGKGRDKTSLAAYKIESGSMQSLSAAQTFVGSVIPPEMAQYFFFDGEAAETFASASNHKALGNAMRSILGCELADTAIADLKALGKHVDHEIGETTNDERIKELEQEISDHNVDIEEASNLRESLLTDIGTLDEQITAIEEGLRDARESQQIQEKRDTLAQDLDRVSRTITATQTNILNWIGQRSVQVVSNRLTETALAAVEEASVTGRIPAPYNEDFVKGLLSKQSCICSRELKPGSKHWTAVADLLKTAANAEVLDRVVRARAQSQNLHQGAVDAPQTLENLQKTQSSLVTKRSRLEQEIAELGKRLEGLPLKELADRERARRKLKQTRDKTREHLGGVKAKIAQKESMLTSLERDLDVLLKQSSRTQRLYVKRRLVVCATEVLRGLLAGYERQARKRIETLVNEILDQVAHKDFSCSVSDDFALELILHERATPKSGGENQLLSLAFIASLVRFAADRVGEDDPILKPGVVAPLILDAPLGQLDPSYQESVAKFLPQLAQQVILLVSGSQGSDRVLKTLEPQICAEYLLVQENVGKRGSKAHNRRVIRGTERDLVLYGQEHTMTRIERLV